MMILPIDADGGDEGIDEQHADRLVHEAGAADEHGAVVVFQHAPARHQRQIATDYGRCVIGRGDEGDVDGKREDHDAEREHQIRDEISERAMLDHQYCTLRST